MVPFVFGIQMPRLSTKLLKGLNIMYGMCGSKQRVHGCYRIILMKIIVCGIVKPTNEFTRLVVNGSSSCGNLTWITARNKLWVRHITNTCDEQDVGFSIDGNLTPNIHFYSDCSSWRVEAYVMDGKTIHFVRSVWIKTFGMKYCPHLWKIILFRHIEALFLIGMKLFDRSWFHKVLSVWSVYSSWNLL